MWIVSIGDRAPNWKFDLHSDMDWIGTLPY